MSNKRRRQIKPTKATESRYRREEKESKDLNERILADGTGLFYSFMALMGLLALIISPFAVGYLIYKAIYG
jgi:hypothetical protein